MERGSDGEREEEEEEGQEEGQGEGSRQVPRFLPALLLTFPKATGTKAKGERGMSKRFAARRHLPQRKIGDGSAPGTKAPAAREKLCLFINQCWEPPGEITSPSCPRRGSTGRLNKAGGRSDG